MNFDFGSRPVGFRSFSVAFVVFLTLVGCDRVEVNVTANVSNPANLPCTCPPDQPPYLVWQKKVDGKQLVVNYHNNGNENEKIEPEFENRTELKRSGDSCFLLFYSVRSSDEGWYTCYYKILPLSHNKIYLEVKELTPLIGSQDTQNTAVVSSVCLCLIIVIIAAVYVGVTCKNRHQMNSRLQDLGETLRCRSARDPNGAYCQTATGTFIATSTEGFNSCQ